MFIPLSVAVLAAVVLPAQSALTTITADEIQTAVKECVSKKKDAGISAAGVSYVCKGRGVDLEADPGDNAMSIIGCTDLRVIGMRDIQRAKNARQEWLTSTPELVAAIIQGICGDAREAAKRGAASRFMLLTAFAYWGRVSGRVPEKWAEANGECDSWTNQKIGKHAEVCAISPQQANMPYPDAKTYPLKHFGCFINHVTKQAGNVAMATAASNGHGQKKTSDPQPEAADIIEAYINAICPERAPTASKQDKEMIKAWLLMFLADEAIPKATGHGRR